MSAAGQSAVLEGYVVRVVAITADAYIAFGSDPAPDTNSTFLPLGMVEYFRITPNEKLGAKDADVNITVMV